MYWLSVVFLLYLLPSIFCAEDYYKLLGIGKSASDRDIKTAYRKLSKKYHPDKNSGDDAARQKFVEVAEAYEALSDSESRRIYDQYGEEGLKQHKQGGGQPQHDPFDLFSRFFGGGGHFGHGGGQRRGQDMEVNIMVPLRDFYNGHDHEFSVDKQQICEECEGSGSADGEVETCSQCGGRGMVIQKHMLAPGIFQQVQMACDKCGGQGKSVKHPCKVCAGSRVVRKVSSYVLHVEKGMPNGAKVVYENEADESPDWVAGDLVVHVVEAEPHLSEEVEHKFDGAFFRRKGRDMFWKEALSLREAWMGDWARNLTHLDGHVVKLSRARGEVIQPNSVQVLQGEGMPAWSEDHADSNESGRLHVEYTVILPDQFERAMEEDFWELWEKWRRKIGVNLSKESGRFVINAHGEL